METNLIGNTSIKYTCAYQWTSLLFILHCKSIKFALDKHVCTCNMFIEMKKFHDGEAIDEGEAAVECVDCIFGRLLQVKASILFSPYDRHIKLTKFVTF